MAYRSIPLALCFAALIATTAAADDGTWSLFLDAQPEQPPSRDAHTAILDPVRHRLIVFGGPNGPPISATWAMSLGAVPNWTRIATAGPQPLPRIWHSAIYDPVRDRMIVFGGDNGGPANDVWALSLAGTPAWTLLHPSGTPPAGRFSHSAIYDPVRDRMIVFGGNYWLNDVWALNLGGPLAWQPLTPAGTAPPARSSHAAIYDPVRDRMVVFGGYASGSYLNDVWALSLGVTPAWSEIVSSGSLPPARACNSAVYDPAGDRLLVYGGYNQFTGGPMSDLWAFSLGSLSGWNELTVSPALPGSYEQQVVLDPSVGRLLAYGGSGLPFTCLSIPLTDPSQWQAITPLRPVLSPALRSTHSATYDPLRRRLVIAGGDRRSNDPSTWALSLGTREWHTLASEDPPGGLRQHCTIYDPPGDRLIAFGGRGNSTGLWQLSMADGSTWQPLVAAPGPAPEGRSEAAAIFDPLRHRMLLFGGLETYSYSNYSLNDVWALSLDGSPTWTQVAPSGTGPWLSNASAFYDPARDRMVVFGGCTAAGAGCKRPPTAPMWELSLAGTPAWNPIAQSGTLPPGYDPAILDVAGDRALVVGTYSPSFGVFVPAVWARGLADGSPWTRLFPQGQAPPLIEAFTATFDSDAGRALIAFSGDYPDDDDQVWALTFGAVASVPPPASRLALAGTLPNPASGAWVVSFGLASAAPATIELLDVAGRTLVTRQVGQLGAGPHTLPIAEARRLPPGVYLLRLRQGAEVVTARASLVR